jgi:hypothetical protein|uniref:Prolyl 4-hydroxylase alpha subunit Fe(2+) 2OG dioxygenase domain-containing protein n=1 Tax=viral metagenome TaxID=1070528 RepID=A0A6C0IJY7_9ZZZZ
MKELINLTTLGEIQEYIEKKENVKLKLEISQENIITKEGHPSHYDTGDSNHMLWCRYSASTLLSKHYKGGEFIFVDSDDNQLESFNQNSHYNKTLVYDINHKHKVNPHYDGDRIVNLYFWSVISGDNPIVSQEVEDYINSNKSKETYDARCFKIKNK